MRLLAATMRTFNIYGSRPFFSPSQSILCLLLLLLLLQPANVVGDKHGGSASTTPSRQPKRFPPRVLPGMASWPNDQEINEVSESLDEGSALIYPAHPFYPNASHMYNLRMIRYPPLIFYVKSVRDVQKVVRFAKKNNLMLSVRSSGHSFIGRSTHHGGVVINMAKMKGKQFNLDPTTARALAGEVTVESGNSWIEVYHAVHQQVSSDEQGNAQRRVIVGGSAHTVAMGGYTLGGGHAPICRKLGMAVDNLLEVTMVLADGSKAVVNAEGTTVTDWEGSTRHSNDTSLFWALRGGGGGTWGVVTHFTFQLHFAPQRIRRVIVNWVLKWWGSNIGDDMIRFVLKELNDLSEDWGGYVIMTGLPLEGGASGHLTLVLNHFGSDDDESNDDVDDLIAYDPVQAQYGLNDTRFATFWDYEVEIRDAAGVNTYIYNTFVQPEGVTDQNKLDKLTEFLMGVNDFPSATSMQSCTGALIGGQMKEVDFQSTPVNPAFRTGLLSLTCAVSWSDLLHQDSYYINYALERRDVLKELGQGVYFNEPDEDLDDWKTQFWGSQETYDRLLDIKKAWDPDNFFWCHNCVGSDLVSNVTTDDDLVVTPPTPDRTTTILTCASAAARKSPYYYYSGLAMVWWWCVVAGVTRMRVWG